MNPDGITSVVESRVSAPTSRANRVVWLSLGIVLLWAILIRSLAPQWSIYPNYGYGWSVPFLCLYLAWERWRTRPEPRASSPQPSPLLPEEREKRLQDLPLSTLNSMAAGPRTACRPFGGIHFVLALFALVLFPTRLLQEANPIWRFASWALALEVVAITFGLVFILGGWRAVRHFAFPIGFFLVAVPWPSAVENGLIQSLTRANAATVVELLGWMGVPVLQRGNLIEISTGLVGIDEACSGLRSFQATVMISLFFGEFYRLRSVQRWLLIGGGAALAFVCNIWRTLTLVWVCDREGMGALSRWHDPAGVSILVACFTGLWLLALWLRSKRGEVTDHADGFARDATFQSEQQSSRRPAWATFLNRWGGLALVAWLVMIEAGTELWFRGHETPPAGVPWSVVAPSGKLRFRELEISDGVRAQLLFNEGHSYAWAEADGSRWQLFSFRWFPAASLKERVIVSLSKSHRPEICLRATGRTLRRELPARPIQLGNVTLPFKTYVFEEQGQLLHVFYCAWEEGTEQHTPANMRADSSARFQAAWQGTRGLGQRVLEIAIWGYSDLASAESALRRELETLVVVRGE
jgi:exosortase